ncbi:oxidoreductase-like [Pediococcus damnosus]|uniref:Oxidoreductase-like n=1 Tax=Pediococcus damnosus TaxID=51663 RepID=A0AAC9B494_9LACO|nr:Gfo/Idh/MocA family oxidoreductase [Pediococcus damnosus]AMV63653.1 oxidoreductase-like [Pediococcus damnosus]AMV66406.1 oxidoreductase-like [Pediococcus damnosus]AMV68705.1 oxidoreductase-like [Pediococcus damnosus]KRN53954.1 Gfo Idh MocA family oxidoreductase [Pediococcus damnosus]PIO80507.1 hypothetical protein BSQ38_02045 [Pediococcus damnosus]
MTQKIIRYGIMGAASIVPRIIAGIRESFNSEVVAIAARKLEKAEVVASQFNISKAYGSYQELCKDPDIDVIYIPLWNAGHYDGAKLALNNHKNVLLEKPFTLKLAQAQELFALAKKQHCFIMEAQKAAFLPITDQVRQQLVTKHAIGDIQGVTIQESHPGIEKIPWFHDVSVGGGAFYGSASYSAEYLQLVLESDITAYQGQISKVGSQADDQVQVNFRLSSGVLASVYITTTTDQVPSQMTFWGTTGSLKVPNYWKTDHYELTVGDKTQKFAHPQASEFVYEFNHVSEQILNGKQLSPIMKPAITLQTTKIIEDLYHSWYAED